MMRYLIAGLTILPFVAAPASAADILSNSQLDSVAAGVCVGSTCGFVSPIPWLGTSAFATGSCSQNCSVSISVSTSGQQNNPFVGPLIAIEAIVAAAQPHN